MKVASVTETKNNLSSILDHVKGGSTVIITERNQSIARIEPLSESPSMSLELLDLERQGLISRPRKKVDLQDLLTGELPSTTQGDDGVTEALLAERRESDR